MDGGIKTMSMYYREHGRPEEKDYSDGRTKQAFVDECSINKILARYQKTGALSHVNQHGAQYGEFADLDYLGLQLRLKEAENLFEKLPGEVKREFHQNPGEFFEFVNDPDNKERLTELLPAIAAPGQYFPDVSPKTPPGALLGAPVIEPPPVVETPPPVANPEPEA